MSLQNRTQQERLNLANALDRASAAVRQNVNRNPVDYSQDITTVLAAAKTELDATIADSTDAAGG